MALALQSTDVQACLFRWSRSRSVTPGVGGLGRVTADVFTLLSGVAGPAGVDAAMGTAQLTAFELLTVDEHGWPHVAWLGPAELLPLHDGKVALAVWSSSTTRRNLERGRAVLQIVVDGSVHRLRLEVEPLGPLNEGGGGLTAFVATVVEVIRDAVNYAQVLSGLTYTLNDPERVLERWRLDVSRLAGAASRR